ncbi:hypothetical protein HYPSUDRAFT_270407 [Hypholoma sublateritium FD-334 SS-4]|uniref:BTB domain-containing protein n=1 Tax=Hypholoma sublateritium (strain FD-334 SS-4) TaxID=945553 RepID=A0A0D2PQ39_HYPSF|nr:hypothetical protein HYPSUDRAFT_270407 [Hypholoma sublateritium FD-334 SS-4]
MHRSQTRAAPPVPAPYHARTQSQSLISPPPASSHPRRPSMHWLSRSNSPPAPAPARPIRSEPRRARTIDSSPRSGTLGAGATVVRTPDEALRETGVRLAPEAGATIRAKKEKRISHHSSVDTDLPVESPPTPTSPPLPPLPPLPALDSEEEETLADPDSPGRTSPPRPSRPPPPAPAPIPRSPSLRSSLKVKTMSTLDDAPTVPPLPAHVAALNQPPPFAAILLSDPPAMAVDPAKTIVTLETCTQTFKTTLETIKSRPSHLAQFLVSLFFRPHHESMASVYSAESDDLSTYRRHLTSQGLLPHTANIHVFLDRASAPYAHILAYLRAPVPDGGQPETLPRALQLQASSSASARLEALIEVRDEAAFLALDGLHKLCTDEIRMRYGPRLHSRGQSSSAASFHSQQASVSSATTLAEHMEQHPHAAGPPSPLPSSDSFSNNTPRGKPTPTPQSWDGDQRSQSRQSLTRNSLKSPPAGWI